MIDFSKYIDYIGRPLIVTDMLYHITLMSASFSACFPAVKYAENIHAFMDEYPVLQALFACEAGQQQISWQGRTYSADISFIHHGRKNIPVARVVLLTDITETEQLVLKAQETNKKLSASNEQAHRLNLEASEKIRIDQQAAAYRETNTLLRELHDTLGHTLTIVNALLSLANMALPDEAASRQELREALRYIDISLAEMQSSGRYEDGGITAFLQRFTASMERIGLAVSVRLHGRELPLHRHLYLPFMRIIQEVATNSIRHGGADKLEIRLSFMEDGTFLTLRDNGRASSSFKKGNGLLGIEERVRALDGLIHMGRADIGGFQIEIKLPVPGGGAVPGL